MQCTLWDSLVWVYPDSRIERPCHSIALDVARGGIASANLLIKGLRKGASVKVQLAPAEQAFRLFRLRHVPVEKNTGLSIFCEDTGQPNPFTVRRAPYRVYDAMEPVASQGFKADAETQALRLHIPIALSAKPGRRKWLCQLTHQGTTSTLRIKLTVHKVRIPPAGAASFPYTNWYNINNMAARHGLTKWSQAHWQMIRRYAELMAHGRQNAFIVPLEHIFSSDAQGTWQLNRQRLHRWVKIFSAAGLHYIEGGHLGGRTGGDWAAPTFSVALSKSLATSLQGHSDIAALTRPLFDEIRRNNWQQRWLQHVADEPIAANAVDYRIFSGVVRKYMPGIAILDATMEPSLVGAVDLWCPQVQSYQQQRDFFIRMQKLGDQVWSYTCCAPGGAWLNRLLDMELLRPTLLGWASALFNLNGYLHWGLNQYRKNQDPFEMSVIPNWAGGKNSLPAGDTHVIYPGRQGPWSGVRFEAQREGLEDLELLRLLQARQPAKAKAILRSVIRGFDDYTKDARVLRAARRKLLQELSV